MSKQKVLRQPEEWPVGMREVKFACRYVCMMSAVEVELCALETWVGPVVRQSLHLLVTS